MFESIWFWRVAMSNDGDGVRRDDSEIARGLKE